MIYCDKEMNRDAINTKKNRMQVSGIIGGQNQDLSD
jgi:hypothetical protein